MIASSVIGLRRSVRPLLVLAVVGCGQDHRADSVSEGTASRPPVQPLETIEIPGYQVDRLPNGLRVVSFRNPRAPVIRIALHAFAGWGTEGTGETGASRFLGALIQEASRGVEAAPGSGLLVDLGPGRLSISSVALVEFRDQTLRRLAEAVIGPDSEEHAPAAGRQASRSLDRDRARPDLLADRVLDELILGLNPTHSLRVPSTLEGWTAAEIASFRRARLRPERSFLLMTGDIEHVTAVELARAHFSSWSPPAGSEGPAPQPRARALSAGLVNPSIVIVDVPGATAAEIRVGGGGVTATSSAYAAQLVAGNVLAGGADSRLFRALREETGWTYGALAYPLARDGRAWLRIATRSDVAVADSVILEIIDQVRTLADEELEERELAAARREVAGSWLLELERERLFADRLADAVELGVEPELFSMLPARLNAVTPDEVREATERVLSSGWVVVAGPADPLQASLSRLGYVQVFEIPQDRSSP